MGDCYNLTNVRVFIQHSVNNHPTLTSQISSTVMVGVQYFPLLPLGVKKDGHVAVTLQWDGSGDHLPNNASSSHVRWDTSQRSLEWEYPVDIWMIYGSNMSHRQRGAQSEVLGTSCIPTITSSAISGDSKFGHAGKWVVLLYLGLGFYLCLLCYEMFLYVDSVEGGVGRNQWTNVWGNEGRTRVLSPPFPFHFSMCPLFTCKTWALHPVPTTR